MQKKLPLFLAAIMMALAFQVTAVRAADDEADDQDAYQTEQDDFCPRWSRGRVGGPFGWRGRGHGPAMPPGMREGRGGPGRMGGMGGMGRMGRMGGMHHGMMGPRMMEQLDLTPAQKEKMVDVLTANFRERLMGRMEIADSMKKLAALHEADKPDADAIVAANRAVGEAVGRMEVLQHKFADGMKSVLTEEQQKKLEELRANFSKRDGREGRGGRDGKPNPRMMRGPGPRMMGPGGR